MSKGDKQRPRAIDSKQLETNWDNTFKTKPPESVIKLSENLPSINFNPWLVVNEENQS